MVHGAITTIQHLSAQHYFVNGQSWHKKNKICLDHQSAKFTCEPLYQAKTMFNVDLDKYIAQFQQDTIQPWQEQNSCSGADNTIAPKDSKWVLLW